MTSDKDTKAQCYSEPAGGGGGQSSLAWFCCGFDLPTASNCSEPSTTRSCPICTLVGTSLHFLLPWGIEPWEVLQSQVPFSSSAQALTCCLLPG